ncbi:MULTISPECIES: ABC transporter permease [Bosea]|jgi:peptide/nickel transport system permease protein|uniref:ABC transporter permease n=1 Tax=Bosea TaxID=85413 RepID=UPI00214FC3FB|nr:MULTISPECIES: ABC transporter permease [Bosea]MCR4520622.1 ABC transporter permease [Bosea sp. 47.2.35]MDR6828437.1 peptide/nickel transport system permease protein [Bosea robiniae]MDR6895096.1 peptide/nickel transport system permease protein [Bosea sp. BE109]MDR7138338.1 peptide/nickel transport system permease protein [Bosea sp. BE168]MDR7175037.1 peptide/nickel transport system permease protein [Bosea sp. BE271]
MTVFVIRRLMQSLLVLAATAVIVFVGVYAIGDPAEMLIAPDATPAERAQVEASLGLDKPLPVQFLAFLGNALKGDLGRSFVFNQPSISLILERLPATLELALVAILIALVIGIPLGLIAGLKPRSVTDETIMTGSILGFSLPNFWQGMMLVMIFSVWLGWLPSSGRGPTGQIFGIETSFASWEGIRHLILPATNLALFKLSLVIRLTRTGVRETMPLDFVKFARAKGLTERRVVLVHVLKTIMIPLVTVIGMEIGSLIAFGVVTETIFAWPGVGKLLIDSIMRLDRPVVVAYLLVVVSLFIVLNFAVDVLYSILDPRIRLGRN